MDDYEYDDRPCPKCRHEPTRSQSCHVVGCDEGWIDLHEYDDPINFSPGEMEMCSECQGTGYAWWCAECGWNNARSEVQTEK